jgi:hypothetical protein
VHLCEACELLSRHPWDAEHVRLRKMGAPAAAAVDPSAAGAQPSNPPSLAPTFMMHATSGRVGFDGLPLQQQVFDLRPQYEPVRAAMLHFTSGRAGFAPVFPPAPPS